MGEIKTVYVLQYTLGAFAYHGRCYDQRILVGDMEQTSVHVSDSLLVALEVG
jgi:hypothetical protein